MLRIDRSFLDERRDEVDSIGDHSCRLEKPDIFKRCSWKKGCSPTRDGIFKTTRTFKYNIAGNLLTLRYEILDPTIDAPVYARYLDITWLIYTFESAKGLRHRCLSTRS